MSMSWENVSRLAAVVDEEGLSAMQMLGEFVIETESGDLVTMR